MAIFVTSTVALKNIALTELKCVPKGSEIITDLEKLNFGKLG